MHKAAFLCVVAAVALSSCVGIDSRLTIRNNGSGVLDLTYRVSQLVVNLGNPVDGKGVIPLPLSKSDFERSLAATQGKVRLTSFDRSEDQKDITIRAQLAFDSLDALAQVDAFQSAQIHVTSDGGNHTFSELIAKAPSEPVTDDSLRMVDAFFGGYDLAFTVEAPQPLKSNTLGTLSADKRVLTYKTTVGDIMRAKNDIVLSMSW
ncbi:MAG: hypothetical protein ACLQCB_15725 [Spirochaetia bacterium]